MSKLFENTVFNNMTLANRFVRSATWEGMADTDGSCTPRLTELMVRLVQGSVGLIITGHTYVTKEGQAGPWQLGIFGDEHLPGLREMTEAVHDAGGKIVMQLAHSGCQAPFSLTGLEAVGPSVMENKEGLFSREMSVEDIHETAQAFGQGASRAKHAGFDGVQLHAAHGYLLSQFLSPFYNKRTDEYGGSLENRARIVLEVLKRVRAAVGNDFPVMIKMNSEDFLDPGMTQDEMLQVAQWLENAGIDAIELSGGTSNSPIRYLPVRPGKLASEEKEVFYREAAHRYKEKIKVPLMLVGGIRSYRVAEQLVNDGLTDYVSMCRPLIREPDLIRRWQSGDARKAACLSDNLCFKPALAGKGIYCVAEEKTKKEC